jgi:phosphinothricin acetyltransferase
MNKLIRLATKDDGEALLSIYGDYITNTSITFETEIPSLEVFRRRISEVLEMFPWLVCELNGQVVGYAYASKHRVRAAYQWSVDVSVYIHPDFHGKQIATALYSALFQLLKFQGFYSVYAGVCLKNIKSLKFHQSFGFQPIGIYHNVGYKLGEWHDVQWSELSLMEYNNPPKKPKTIDEIKTTKEFHEILDSAIKIIRDK